MFSICEKRATGFVIEIFMQMGERGRLLGLRILSYPSMFSLNDAEKKKLADGVSAVLSLPFIDDVEDFIWEGIFCHVKDLPLQDSLLEKRSKRLFDIVDENNHIGWSAKALQWPLKLPAEIELVIQRADIFKKAKLLGYESLSKDTDVSILGEALLRHWNSKIIEDASIQNVVDSRVCILIKSRDRKKFAYLEEKLRVYNSEELVWHWTDDSRTGLQGVHRETGLKVFRWYPNQKQLFERFQLTVDTYCFELTPRRLPIAKAFSIIATNLIDG